MKIQNKTCALFLGLVITFAGCGINHEMKKDAEAIGNAMCRNIEIQNKLLIVKPEDSVSSEKLHAEADKLETEMEVLYREFGKKYGEKIKDAEFNKKFSRELRKAMLKCPFLSKEDREQFEKYLKE